MPSVSKKQQKFMGIVRAIQKGEADPSDFNKDAQDAAKKMKKSSVKKYAKTKHKGLPNKKVNEGRVLHFTQIKDKTLEKHLKVIAKKVGATVSKISGGFKVDADNDGRKLAQVVDYIFDKSLMKGLMSGGGMSRVQLVNESNGSKRDYKAEYKKFQSSPKAKKYRAELNKYNRQKGTYGNGDGKDASHKGGKIVGFEKESTNRGRAEKSRLKKEINDYVGSIVNEVVKESTYSPQTLLQIAKQLKEADESVDEIKVWDLNEKCWKGYEKKGMKTMFGKRYPNCVKKKKSESVNEQSKVIKSIDNLAKKNKYGTVTGTRMNGKTANTIMKIYNHPKMKSRQKDLDKFTSDELVNLTISRDIIRILGLNEAVYKFRGYTNTQMDELDAMLARAGYKGTPDFNKMTWTTKDRNPKIAKIIKSKGGKKIKESVNERAWTPAQEKAVKELDKKFYKLIGKKGIEPYSYEASQMWTSGGFRKEMRKIFGKDVKESVNENISDSEKFKIYNSLKKGDIVSIKYDSSIGKGSKFHPFLVTKGKTKLMKGRVERIIMVPASGSKAKRYLYNRGGRISLALGDMAASIIDMKKGKVNEGTCGYGVDGKLGEEPAGPHLIKKKKKKIKEDIEMSKGVKKLMKIADEGFGKVGGTTVDSMSASLFKQIYNKVNDDIKKQLNTKNEKQLVRIIAGMWKKFGKNVKIGSSL